MEADSNKKGEQFVCSICSQGLASLSRFKAHLLVKHGENLDSKEKQTQNDDKIGPRHCEKCDKRYKTEACDLDNFG